MSTDKPLIIVAEPYLEEAVGRLRAIGDVVQVDGRDESELTEVLKDAQALLVRSYTQVTRSLIENAPRLRVIGRGGVGLENIDLAAAREHKVAVVYTPGAATEAVADLTVGLMIAVSRQIVQGDAAVRQHTFAEARRYVCERDLSQCTIGIIGMGRVGRAVARRCQRGFGATILYNDMADPGWLDVPAERVSKETVYERSDIVTLHVPLTDQTKSLINKETLAQFKAGAMLINTSRGQVVDSHALIEPLKAGQLSGVGLDVVDPEPLPMDHPLLAAPNLVLTPHIGAKTSQGLTRMNAVVDDVVAVLEGRSPNYPVG